MRLATEASLEDCFVMLRVRSSCYVTYVYATNRRNSVSRDCTAESAPREWELSGQQHMRTYLPDLPTAVTPWANVSWFYFLLRVCRRPA